MVTLSRSFELDISSLGSSITTGLGSISQSWWPQHMVGTAVSLTPLNSKGRVETPSHATMLLTLFLLAGCCKAASSGPQCPQTWKAPLGVHCPWHMLAWNSSPCPPC